jgi:glucose-1-phosphatase
VSVDTLILDLGGVLIDVDYHASARHFASLGLPDFGALYSKARQSDLFDRFETGELSPQGFRDEVRSGPFRWHASIWSRN